MEDQSKQEANQQKETFSLRTVKYAEYVRDITALGNPIVLLLVSVLTLAALPELGTYLLPMIVGFLLNEALCSGIKFLWHKPRPNGQQYAGGLEKIDAGSFPSIHAARIAYVYGTLGMVHYWMGRYWVLLIALSVIVAVGYSRVFLQKHYFLDVMAGYGFGSLAIFLLHLWLF